LTSVDNDVRDCITLATIGSNILLCRRNAVHMHFVVFGINIPSAELLSNVNC